jgi:hypothetical protein
MPSPEPLGAADGETLLRVARESIGEGLARGRALPVRAADFPEPLRAARATFVTLHRGGLLRGCIGALEVRLPLVEDVALHAFAAAFQDPRFPPLEPPELCDLDIHVSILTPSTRIDFRDEPELLRQLRPGVDGLTIAQGNRRATFLPSVWESLPDPGDFLQHLKRKAGISGEAAAVPLLAWRYTVQEVPASPREDGPARCAA